MMYLFSKLIVWLILAFLLGIVMGFSTKVQPEVKS